VTQYFFTPAGPDVRRQISATIWGHKLSLTTSTGVFSAGRLDPGTAVLLGRLDPPVAIPENPAPRLLDLGCGFGPIALALALACPKADVTAIDVNDRALELTRLNAKTLGVPIQVMRPEEVPPGAQFDEIWSNPPIHVGKPALHELLTTWLRRLSPGGRAYLVVQKNLGADSLQTWLERAGWPTNRLASAKGYRILAIDSPPPEGWQRS